MKEIQDYQFKQIQNLIISLDYKNQNYIIKVLFRLFPRIKHLTCLTSIIPIDVIIRIVSHIPKFGDLQISGYVTLFIMYSYFVLLY
jgi:hypothetical protein